MKSMRTGDGYNQFVYEFQQVQDLAAEHVRQTDLGVEAPHHAQVRIVIKI